MIAGVLDRFWSKVEVVDADDCCLGHNGYGQFSIGRTNVRAHRFAYEATVGPIPNGLVTDHTCGTRACCNPSHLDLVTAVENGARGNGPHAINARKTHCTRGHALAGPNLHVRPDRRRRCRTCDRERLRRRRALARAS